MVNTKIRLAMLFVAEDGETVYSQQKKDQELTVVQIISFSWENSGLKKAGKTTRPAKYNLIQIP